MQHLKNILCVLLLFAGTGANCQIITTIAGIPNTRGYGGDGGPASAASLSVPMQAKADNAGNIYIADYNNNCIRKINAAGIITTIAGNGTAGYSGDGGQATAAELHGPAGVAIDINGNIYIADAGNTRIRKVDASGIITTIAGNGASTSSGDGGPATAAGFTPADIIADSMGDVFISDKENSRVRKINTSGIITTLAGNGTSGFAGDGGPATSAELSNPFGLCADDLGNIYIADYLRVRRVNAAGIITTIAGNGTLGFSGDGGLATAAAFNALFGVFIDIEGNIYIADAGNARIRAINTSGIITTISGNGVHGSGGDGGLATLAELDDPSGIAADRAGNIYITDGRVSTVRKIAAAATGIEIIQSSANDVLSIWPAPNDGDFTINLSSASAEPIRVIITNAIGQTIKTLAATANKNIAIRLDAPAGMYFITAITSHGKQAGKVVVQ